MRFHFGISFNWRTIKKFLFPILIGLLAYLGLGGIFNLSFIRVNAQENYDSTFTINYSKIDLFDSKIDDNVTFTDFVEHINSIESNYYNIIVSPTIYNNSIIGVSIITVPKSYSFINIDFFGQNNTNAFTYRITSYNFVAFYKIPFGSDSDIYNNSIYLDFVTCIMSNTCNNRTSQSRENYTFGYSSTNMNNNDSFDISLVMNSNYFSPKFIYSTQVPIVFNNSLGSENNYLFKKIVINDEVLNVGDYFVTYLDYIESLPTPDPENPDSPIDDTTEHKALFDKIYWFDDKNTIYGVLTSIYELLFLYCLTMILFKIATFLRNTRW